MKTSTYELGLKSLHALVAVAETGSVKQAAQDMHLTQPALSQHLARVSEKYGAKVVERRGRGIQLTEVGRIVVAYARDIQRCLDTAELAVADLHGLTRGRIRIGVLQSVNMHLIPRAIAQLNTKYPGIRTTILELSNDQIEQAVTSGDLDLGIGLTQGSHELVSVTSLYSDTIVLAGDPIDDACQAKQIRLQDVAHMPLALLTNNFTTRKMIDFHCLEAGILLRPAIETNTIGALLELIRAGQFKTLIPYTALLGAQGLGLSHIQLADPHMQRSLSLIRREDSVASPAAKAFATMIQGVVSELLTEHPSLLSGEISQALK